MKKFFLFISTLILSLVFVNNITFAQTKPHIYKTIDFVDFMDSEGWEIVSIGNQAFTATGVLNVPGLDTSIDINDAIELYARMPHSLEKGTPNTSYQRYTFSEISGEPEKVRLDISLNKMNYTNWCLNTGAQCDGNNPDPTTLHYYMSEYFAGYYISNVPSPFMTEYKAIDFSDVQNWALLSIGTNTFTVSTILELPDIVQGVHPNEVIEMYVSLALNLTKGEPSPIYSHYIFEPTNEPNKVILRMSVNKFYYTDWCTRNDMQCSGDSPNLTTFHLYMSEYFAGYYIIRFPIEIIDYEYPEVTMRLPYNNIYGTIENEYTYEFIVGYRFELSTPIPDTLGVSDYYLITKHHIPLIKGIHRYTNTYEFYGVSRFSTYGTVELRITLTKDFITDENGSLNYDFLYQFLIDDTALYIKYFSDSGSVDYDIGYSNGYNNGITDGYNSGYNAGYNSGYNAGYNAGLEEADPTAYQRGYNDGARSSFQANLHVWIVPAIIIVVIAGIFVGYRRERYYGD